jgi:hypothetical protein
MRPRHLAISVGVVFAAVATSGGTVIVPAVRNAITRAPVTGHGETAFLAAILTDLHDPVTEANVSSLAAWVARETAWPPVAANNPLDSERPAPGSTPFNPAGVQNYQDAAEGAAMTAVTLANGDYPHILADLAAGTGLCTGDPATAADFLTWSNRAYSSPVCG